MIPPDHSRNGRGKRQGSIPGLLKLLCLLVLIPANQLHSQGLLREVWMDIGGSSVEFLTGNERFPDSPDQSVLIESFEVPENTGDNFGTRVHGFIVPPETGDYVFYLSGDDNCELRVAGEAGPDAVMQVVATVATWTGFREWDKFDSQQSQPVYLVAGEAYRVEVLHKEGTGGDHLSVGWERPSGSGDFPIPGLYLRAPGDSSAPPTIVDDLLDTSVVENMPLRVTIGATGAPPLTYQWFFNGSPLREFPESILEFPVVPAEWDQSVIFCRISNPFGSVDSASMSLDVVSESIAPVIAFSNPAPGSRVAQIEYLEIFFSEPVRGVMAEHLTVSGTPALEVEGSGAGPYRFQITAPGPGDHAVRLAPQGAVTDLAITPNTLSVVEWTFTVIPAVEPGVLLLTEIQTINSDGHRDADGNPQDWIEIWNPGLEPVNIAGWSLSDDEDQPGQWIFPDVTVGPGDRLLVFASGLDRRGRELHTSFKMGAGGEFLGLFGPGTPRPLIHSVGTSGEYPPQRNGYSYGIHESTRQWGYFSTPTPGAANSGTPIREVSPVPHFSVERGVFRAPFSVVLSVGRDSPEGTVIRYTTDGSEPGPVNGRIYSGPIAVDRSLTIRAAGFTPGRLPSPVESHSYIHARNDAIAMLPVISISTDRSNLRGRTGIMEVNPRNTTQRGIAWERPCSAEWIFPDGRGSFQINCGLRVQGGNYVRERYNPNGGLPFSKYSFRLYFRSEYGEGKLRSRLFPDTSVDEFDVISLRAGMNDHSNPFIIDELVRRLYSDMGHVSAHGTFAHLFINGEYQGYYNPTERIDDRFLDSYYGDDFGWDIVAQFGETREGDRIEWNRMMSAAMRDQTNPANFNETARLLDIDAFIDYLLVNIYAGTGDWPHNNWRAARQRKPDAKWKFIVWDAEWAFGNQNRSVNVNTLTEELRRDAEISNIFQSLRRSPEFRLRFADRVHHHLFNEGILQRLPVRSRFMEMVETMREVIPGMQITVPSTWINSRWRIMLTHLEQQDLIASDTVPIFSHRGPDISRGAFITLESDETGEIYYTMDGSDPRVSSFSRKPPLVVIPESAPKRVLIPSSDPGSDDWKGGNEPFDDRTWRSGRGGVGYDNGSDYQPFIDTDVAAGMRQGSTACYIRIPFTIDSDETQVYDRLLLEMRYDDGFTAWLNGTRIAGANMPSNPAWNDGASSSHSDNLAVTPIQFDITQFRNLLKDGTNILAIQGGNVSPSSSDFLISPRLVLDRTVAEEVTVSESAILYDGPIQINDSATVTVRAIVDGQWSALDQVHFEVSDLVHPVRFTELMYHPPGDPEREWIEISNLGSAPVDIGSWSLDGVGFRFEHGTVLEKGQSIVLISEGGMEAFAADHPSVLIGGEFSGELSNAGETLRLFTAEGIIVDEIRYGDSGAWPGQADGGGFSIELSSADAAPSSASSWWSSRLPGGSPGVFRQRIPAGASVFISELLAFASMAGDATGEDQRPSDWVEFSNPSSQPIDLGGWRLSDDPDDNARFVFPPGTSIDAGAYMVIGLGGTVPFASHDLTVSFSLDRDGESLYLFDGQGRMVDGVDFGFLPEGYSLARLGGAWHLGIPSPAEANVPAELGDSASIRFNEWMAVGSDSAAPWFELTSIEVDKPVQLTGLRLVDGDWVYQLRRHSYLGAGEYVVYDLERGMGPGEIPSRPLSDGDALELFDSEGRRIDRMVAAQAIAGRVYGLIPDGTGSRRSINGNGSPGQSNFLAQESPLGFNEVMVRDTSPVDGGPVSWVELINNTDSVLDLSGYSILDVHSGAEWHFPSGTTVGPGQFTLVAMDPHAVDSGMLNSRIAMDHSGGHFRLTRPDGTPVDELLYGPQIPGISLQPGDDSGELLELPTPGEVNSAVLGVMNPPNLVINEWRASHPFQPDWFEVYNPNDSIVTLESVMVSDSPFINESGIFRFPPSSFIGPRQMARFYAMSGAGRLPWAVPFQLDGDGELLRLYTRRLDVIHQVVIPQVNPFETWGLYPDGSESIRIVLPTPGFPNVVEVADPPVDSDMDGIPDFWELDMDLNPLDRFDAVLDMDQDGIRNIDEFVNGLNPWVPDELLRISGAHVTDGQMIVEIDAQPGSTFILEWTPQLGPLAQWEESMRDTGLPGGGRLQLSHPVANGAGFFRVRQIPAD